MGIYEIGTIAPRGIKFYYYGNRFQYGPRAIIEGNDKDYEPIYSFEKMCNTDYTPKQLIIDFIKFYDILPEDVKNNILNDEYKDTYMLEHYCITYSTLTIVELSNCSTWFPNYISESYLEHLKSFL